MSVARCHGSGQLYEVLTPRLDPRDPAFDVREWECPGCLDCLTGQLVDADDLARLDDGPQVTLAIVDEGIVVIEPALSMFTDDG